MNFLKILIHPFFYKFLNKFEVIVRLMHVIETLMGDDLVSLDFMAWKTNQFSLGFFFNVLSARRSQFFPGRPKSTNNGAGDLYALWQSLAWTLLLDFLCVRLDYRLNSSQLNKVYKQTRSSCDLPRYGRVMESKVSSLPATETWTGRGPSKLYTHRCVKLLKGTQTIKKKVGHEQMRAVQMIPQR